MDNQKKGEELNQISRFLFDAAAHNFYLALGIEILIGFIGIISSYFNLSSDTKLAFAFASVVLLILAYALKIKFDNQYDTAETMRRQSVLTEALNWEILEFQFRDWKIKAGKTISNKIKTTPRSDDYYSTREDFGPRKLAEMTIESAFYTRSLYLKIDFWAWFIFIAMMGVFFTTLSISSLNTIPDDARSKIVYFIYSIIPLLISINILGVAIKLSRVAKNICEIEMDLDRLVKSSSLDTDQVMRLVSEYNCQVSLGVAIHNLQFQWWHNEIDGNWKNKAAKKYHKDFATLNFSNSSSQQ